MSFGVRAYCLFAERNRELFQVMFAGGVTGIGLGRELQSRFAELARRAVCRRLSGCAGRRRPDGAICLSQRS